MIPSLHTRTSAAGAVEVPTVIYHSAERWMVSVGLFCACRSTRCESGKAPSPRCDGMTRGRWPSALPAAVHHALFCTLSFKFDLSRPLSQPHTGRMFPSAIAHWNESEAEAAALATFIRENRWSNYWYLIPSVILVYDHLLTLAPELAFVWRKHRRLSFWLFVPLRYLALGGTVAMLFLNFGPVPYEQCHIWTLAKVALIVVQCALAGVILVLRVYALYNCHRGILALFAVVGTGAVVAAVWSIFGQHALLAADTSQSVYLENAALTGCHYAVSPHLARRLALAWQSQLVCDILIFGLTLWRSLYHRYSLHDSLITTLIRDGSLYFAVLGLVNAANILMYYLGDEWTADSLSWFASTIAVTMISRLMLNLHRHADIGVMATGAGSSIPAVSGFRVTVSEDQGIEELRRVHVRTESFVMVR
ncbi:hypothetical protein MIND_00917800 [Mycena indigotica]|uniref:DUF6533 domain-containing protein n=1 Tax=Mycena indigotica TaxID=2126181 RepID=A0A8H6SDQ3_9AGAR|nr:uncharacterized protein MIND_00917800 [Mycena indigotica]KAF7296865.1 hypothetical protein MIND_00917800 [Mycena indigotica]